MLLNDGHLTFFFQNGCRPPSYIFKKSILKLRYCSEN